MEKAIPIVLVSILYLISRSVQDQVIRASIRIRRRDLAVPPVHENGLIRDGLCE